MAFATSLVTAGSAGDMRTIMGKFTASKGDADGTITVGGSLIAEASFWDAARTTPSQVECPWEYSTNSTTGITTFTVNVSGGVTDGRFRIVYR